MNTSFPNELEKLLVDEETLLSFEETVKLKDFCPNKVKKLVPDLSSVITKLVGLVEKKKYITVDVMKHNFLNRGKTCSDVSFHVDGINNEYVIWSIGDYRTEFLMKSLNIPGLGNLSPKELAPSIRILADEIEPIVIEAPSSVPMKYNSACVHRGRIAESGSKRIMIRVCSSDYISPKNFKLR